MSIARSPMRPLMVLGCTSDAGKSLLVTALCRWFARHGVAVAPFKAQNMSNNARLATGLDGDAGEIGVAQWLQARAAGIRPDVRMNPVLLKPESDTGSQVVVCGRADRALTQTPWRERHDALWEPMAASLASLRAEFDLVVIEGAGSPAEINLRDQVNNRMIEHADAAGLLVSDIDRGGSFAHLYGTWALVPEATRGRLAGFVLNRFRGDPTLLAPGPELLTERTGMRHVGVVPMLAHDLPREEGAAEPSPHRAGATTVVFARLPYGSNLDEFRLLGPAANVVWATDAAPFHSAVPGRDAIVLPGSKHVLADLAWLRDRGIAAAVIAAARRGVRVVGVCGGAMMLGRSIDDPAGIDGSGRPESAAGLGLLDHATTMVEPKISSVVDVEVAGRTVPGYEIRYGRLDHGRPVVDDGTVWATTVHGLFEDPAVVRDVLALDVDHVDPLEGTFELLADAVDDHLDTTLLRRLVTP